MKQLLCTFTAVLMTLCMCGSVDAEQYGPTLNDVVRTYAATRSFDMLNESLSRERINIRLGMTREEVEQWAASSAVYELSSSDTSIYKFDSKDFEVSRLSFEVWLAKGRVVVIKTFNINNFEVEDNDLGELKALRPVRTDECWVRQNYVDPHSYENGYDFALMIYRGIPLNEAAACMGSDRANIAIGQPGVLYPKHVKKN